MNIPEVIRELAEKFGVAAEYLFAVLVRQGVVEGAYGVLFFLIGVLFAYIAYRLVEPISKLDSSDEVELVCGIFLISAIAGIGIVCMGCGISYSMYLWNPEYFAIHKVLELLGK